MVGRLGYVTSKRPAGFKPGKSPSRDVRLRPYVPLERLRDEGRALSPIAE